MSPLNLGSLDLRSGILRELTPDASRLILWLPVPLDGRSHQWERIGTAPGAPTRVEDGIRALPATSIPAKQQPQGLLATLLRWFRRNPDNQTWLLPNGQTAIQTGDRQTDLVLGWAEDEATPLDATCIKAHWPQLKRIQQLGKSLFLVVGVNLETGQCNRTAALLQGKACQQAQELLARARQASDRRAEAAALIDLGTVTMHGGNASSAIILLQEALSLSRQLGDQPRERDALLNLGMAAKAAGQLGRAQECLSQALGHARAAGDRFAEKLTLEHLASFHASQRNFPRAIALYEEALTLAQAVGHRQHEADLLWNLAIQHAELGQRDQAVTRGQAALVILTQLGHPQLQLFMDNLEQYRRSAAAFSWIAASGSTSSPDAPSSGPSAAGAALAPPVPGLGQERSAAGPGLLRMALSVAKATAQFVGSGLKTVSPTTQQQRLEICAGCEHHTGVRCKLCGCFTSVKTKLPHETCPLGKWPR